MNVEWTPMRWPAAWTNPATLALLRGTSINYLLVEPAPALDAVRAEARKAGLQVADPAAMPAGISLVKGEWAGVRMSRGQSGGGASAGPTGAAWVNSNGWAIRLAAALHPTSAIWIDAPPAEGARITADSYVVTLADTASHGGRWVIALDNALATGLAAERPESMVVWKRHRQYRAARIATVDAAAPRSVEMVSQKEAVEVHLPQVPQYVALELEV